MGYAASLLLVTALAAPQVEISTLNGEQHTGQLVSLTPDAATIAGKDGEQVLPVASLLEVRFPAPKGDDMGAKAGVVQLTDGTRLSCSEISATARKFTLAGPYTGSVELPPATVSSLRFAPPDDRIESDWQKLTQRSLKRDLLVLRKGDVLDYQDGITGDIDDKIIKFSVEGEEIPVKREKVFGLIFAGRPASQAKPRCRMELGKSDELFLESVVWDGRTATVALVAGARVELKPEVIRGIDYSLGKVRYLSLMEPRDVKYTPFFDIVWEYRRDRNLDGGPIRIGKQEYARGLSIHSRTALRYRLGGEYRRFQAVMGIDAAVAANGRGDVRVVISGDGKTLLDAEVKGSDPARPLDLDVTDVRDLEILVDFGGDLDISDHLDLADAKVIK